MHEELKDLEGILAYTEAKTALESGEDDARPPIGLCARSGRVR